MNTLRQDITTALNRHSAEQNSNTPDFILAEYLIDCLAAYDRATAARHRHHHGVNETMEMVFTEPQLPATPTTPTFDLPPIGATLMFLIDNFYAADEQIGNIVTVTEHGRGGFFTTTNTQAVKWGFPPEDWHVGLEIVKLPQP